DLGNQQQVTLDWWRLDADTWRARIAPDGNTTAPADGMFADINFGGQVTAGPPPVNAPAGTISGITPLNATTGTVPISAGESASLGFTVNYGYGNQTVQIGLGAYGVPTGLTSYSGTEYSVRNLSQDGVPLGAYSGVTVRE